MIESRRMPTSSSCPHCGKTFTQPGNLTTHIRIVHEQRRDYACPHCDKNFSVKTSLKNHIRSIHQLRRDYDCPWPQCGRAFTEKGSLQRHIRGVHEGRRDFVCPLCPKPFIDRSALRKHLRAVHGDDSVPLCDTVQDESLKDPREDEINQPSAVATGAWGRTQNGCVGAHKHLDPRITKELLHNLVQIARECGTSQGKVRMGRLHIP